MSATIITMAEFKAAAEQVQQAAQFVRRPVSVLVHWSESGQWEEGQTLPYADFEAQAAAVAIPYAGRGYQKTKITVNFDDGETYECRVDLSATGEHGFTDHCLAMLRYYDTEKGQARLADCGETSELIEFLRGVDFGADAAAVVAANREAGQIAEEREQQRQEDEKQAAIEARRQARELAERQTEAWRATLVIPTDAKAAIIARRVSLDEENSDPYADYYKTQTDEVIILAWSKHTRDLFAEMRKAAKNHPETAFLADPEQSQEHREKYSMGKGFYLTNKGYIRAGWIIEKQQFWGANDKASHLPMGQIAIPGYVGQQVAEQVEQAAEVVEAQPAAEQVEQAAELAPVAEVAPILEQVAEVVEAQPAPAQVKPKFTAQRVGGLWSVSIEQGEDRQQFDGIEAASLAEACRIAWALLTQTTPPDDDPSGQPLPVELVAEQAAQVEQGAEAPTLTRADLLGDYAARVEEKRERLNGRAVKAIRASDARYQRSMAITSAWYPGQPILVGHHSERRHRRDLARSDANMRQSVELSRKAERLGERAEAVGTGGIASDNPEALAMLRAKLDKREARQQRMKDANKATPGTFPAWELRNNNAEIRRLRQRIEQIEQLHQAAPIERAGDGWQMREEDGRILIEFNGKPAAELRQMCKCAGFVWAPSRCAWVRKISPVAVAAAERLARDLPV